MSFGGVLERKEERKGGIGMLNYKEDVGYRLRRAQESADQRISHLKIELDEREEDDHWVLFILFSIGEESGLWEDRSLCRMSLCLFFFFLVLMLKYRMNEVQKFRSIRIHWFPYTVYASPSTQDNGSGGRTRFKTIQKLGSV